MEKNGANSLAIDTSWLRLNALRTALYSSESKLKRGDM